MTSTNESSSSSSLLPPTATACECDDDVKRLPVVTTHDACCDECGGSNRIRGTKYKASHIYDYDLCSVCYNDKSQEEKKKYVPFHEPVEYQISRDMCPVEDTGVTFRTALAAARIIKLNQHNKVAYVCIRFNVASTTTPEACERFQNALSTNNQLEVLHIYMQGRMIVRRGDDVDDSSDDDNDATSTQCFTAIAKGIAANTSIRKLFWHIGDNLRNKITASSLRDIIAENTTLEGIFLRRLHPFRLDTEPSDNCYERSDTFATIIFDGLKTNSTLATLRLSSYNVLSEHSKETLLEIIKTNNTTIRRVHAEFKHVDDHHRLEFLLACNREKWTERLVDIDATKRDQLEVLLEALQYDGGETLEPVSIAYHLLRNRPDLCSK